jgi:hypothetical protein
MRRAGNAHGEVIATGLGDIGVGRKLNKLLFDRDLPHVRRVRVEVVNLDLPQHPRGGLNSIEALPIDEHIPARKGVARDPVGTSVRLVIAAPMRHRPRPALGAAEGESGLGGRIMMSGPNRIGVGLGLEPGSGAGSEMGFTTGVGLAFLRVASS